MKKSCIVFKSNDPALIRRFAKWIKWSYNVEYPVKEYRGAEETVVIWVVGYMNDWIMGSSERKLEAIANAATREHWAHAHPTEETWVDWEIYSN